MNEVAEASAVIIDAAVVSIIVVFLTVIVTALIVVGAELVADLVERWLGSDGGGS